MKITNSISTLLAIITAIPLALGGIAKGFDIVRYNLLGMAHNDEEVFIRHMKSDHLYNNEDASIVNMQTKNEGLIKVATYKDGCIVIKRQTKDGMTSSVKILPEPEYIEKIKEIYSGNDNIAYASEKRFEFGVHKEDFNYTEENQGMSVIRLYGDGCCLSYKIDNYGYTYQWRWRVYSHKIL